MSTKIKVKSVTIERAEGPTHLCNKPVTVATLDDATIELLRWSHTAPGAPGESDLGYDKCDFRIEFEDGYKYNGRFDLKYLLKGEGSLAQHVRSHVQFYAGLYCPAHLTREKYETFLRQTMSPDDTRQYRAFLDTYDLEATL